MASKLGILSTTICNIHHGMVLANRYVCPSNLRLFVLVEADTQKEYVCGNNGTICLHLGVPTSKTISISLTLLKKQIRKTITINNRLFYLKGFPPPRASNIRCHRESAYMSKIVTEQRKQKLIRNLLRSRIHHALDGKVKASTTMSLVGCPIESLFQHLEKQFQEGMTWENRGKWHIDHIRPCYTFDLSQPEQQRACFHYTNLRPLWAKDNLSRKRTPSCGRI